MKHAKLDYDNLTPEQKAKFRRLLKDITNKRWGVVCRGNDSGLDLLVDRWLDKRSAGNWGKYLRREREIREGLEK
jgi:hypothetical protein